MQNVKFVDARHIETLEQYGSALVASTASLKALELFHVVADNKGLFNEVEKITANNILAQLKHLFILYKNQMLNIKERSSFNEDDSIRAFRKEYPDVKIPRKKKNVKQPKEQQNGQSTPSDVERTSDGTDERVNDLNL